MTAPLSATPVPEIGRGRAGLDVFLVLSMKAMRVAALSLSYAGSVAPATGVICALVSGLARGTAEEAKTRLRRGADDASADAEGKPPSCRMARDSVTKLT